MAAISPTITTLLPNEVQSFSSSGITSPVWTLEGPGTLTQSGVYTAPNSGATVKIRVHDPFWSSVNSSFFTLNPDDTLTKNTATPGYFAQAKSNGRLNVVGDYVEFVVPKTNPYWIGVANDALTHQLVYYAGGNPNFLWTYHPGGNFQLPIPNWIVGDVIRIELITGGFLRVAQNGVVRHTTSQVFTGQNLRFVTDADFASGTVVRVPVMVVASGYAEAITEITVAPPLPYGFSQEGTELFCEASLLAGANGSTVSSFTDQSLNFRHLTAASSQPTLQTNVVNGRSVVRFNGSQNPLSVTSLFTIRCGWVVARFAGSSFSGFQGLLTDLVNQSIFTSNDTGTNFFNFGIDLLEFRSNDRLYPASAAPAPFAAFRLLFFRFWRNMTVTGIRVGQDRDFTARKFNGDVALVALSSAYMSEEQIRARSAAIATAYGITLADVYPYQADRTGTAESVQQTVRVYDPPEGNRIAEVLNDSRRTLDLRFSSRRQTEIDQMRAYHQAHYPDVPFVYRNYNVTPPVDIEGYLDSPYSLDGSLNNYSYGWRFREK